jgi:3-deoxy-manno-octulosonate cytidylyltransferase (CMP-KDO synthetase)
MEVVAVIPARFASTRLPGKPLLAETGKPLIQHVVESARMANRIDRVIVATDDVRIAAAVADFGGEAVMTRFDHPSGTDRVAEVAASLPEARVVVNLQGDEPDVSGRTLDHVITMLEKDPEAPMATVATAIRSESVYHDPSCVKVVCSRRGRAIYFSRAAIPHHHGGLGTQLHGRCLAYLHLGLYAYHRDFLLHLANLPPSPLESAEGLEQLRALEAGYPISVGVVEDTSVGINTPEEYRRFVEQWLARRTASS